MTSVVPKGIEERVTEVQHPAVTHAAAKLDARPQRKPPLDHIDRDEPDTGLIEEPVQVIDRPQPVRLPPAS
jgi:hypothetical protein